MGAEDIREHALTSTPDTLDWDCFTFGIIQKPDHFTFYASVDHLHIDGMSAGIIFLDIHQAYQDLIAGRPVMQTEVGGYRGYTARQSEQVATLDVSSPEIRDWITFAQDTDGDWPSFPLELGDTWSNNTGDYVTVELLNDEQTEAFDSHAAMSAHASPAASWRARAWPSTSSPATPRFTASPLRTPACRASRP